jgi:hypothetical protein
LLAAADHVWRAGSFEIPTVGHEMAVAIRLKLAGGTREQYDTVHGHMGIDENPPAGMIFQSAGRVDGGWV